MNKARIAEAQDHLAHVRKLLEEQNADEPDLKIQAMIVDVHGLQHRLHSWEPEPAWIARARKGVFPQTDAEKEAQLERYCRTGST